MMQELKIDKRLEELFPPLSAEAFKQLEENILAEGVMEKLVVWDGTIVDGHNRYKIFRKHNIPFETVEKEFADIDEAIIWMIAHQIGRRNMSQFDRLEKALLMESMIKDRAKKNLSLGGGDQKSGWVTGPKAITAVHTNEELGKLSGTSEATVKRFRKIKESGDDEVYEKVRLGPKVKGGLSVKGGYDEVMRKAREVEQKEQGVKTCTLCTFEKPLSDFRKGGSVCKTCLSSVESLGMSVTEFREKYHTTQMSKLAVVYDKMKNPPPSSGSGNNSLSDDPIITEMTETIKNFRNAMNKFLFIEEKTDKVLKDLIKETIEELNEINSIIKE